MMTEYVLLIAAVGCVVVGSLMLIFAWLRRRVLGIFGQVRYQDFDTTARVLSAPKYQLYGKPDLLLEKNGQLIPVELKMGATPATPHANHVVQVLAYCLLVEECYGVTPPYGLIRYRQREFEVQFSPKAKSTVLGTLTQMRLHLQNHTVAHRQHHQAGRCRACQFRARCAEVLP